MPTEIPTPYPPKAEMIANIRFLLEQNLALLNAIHRAVAQNEAVPISVDAAIAHLDTLSPEAIYKIGVILARMHKASIENAAGLTTVLNSILNLNM